MGESTTPVWRLALLLGVAMAHPAPAQNSAPDFARRMWHDEVRVVTSPLHIAKKDWAWLLPVGGATAFLLTTDERTMRERIHTNPVARDRSLKLSNLGLGALAAIPPFLAWQGWRHRESYDEETGWLAARAVADTVVTSEMLRLITRRERPTALGAGDFFRGGTATSSFPSMHAASAWALASVVAHRYPGWLAKAAVYGLAGGVSVSRVVGREHSPSDAFVGSALGWLIGRYVAGTGSHPPAWNRLAGVSTGATPKTPANEPTVAGRSPSSYVPMDSWIYGALDRLASLGLIPSQISGLRPWTRAECLRQTREAASRLPQAGASIFEIDAEASALVSSLQKDFEGDSEAPGVVLESIYVRNGAIGGRVLDNSFHFGQTWTNDSGRPFGRGWNSYDGFTVSARSGNFFAYANGEVQHAPGSPALSLAVRQTISALDAIPLQPAQPISDTNRFRTIEAYAGVRLGGLEFSVGKQALWWGPTYDAPLSFSTNAEPTKNLKISTAHPFHLWLLGDIRAEFVMGKLGGQAYTWRPWFNALKISFKLTPNLEMGFTRWSIFWGVGHPINVRSFIRNFTSTSSPAGSAEGLLNATDPGDRKGGFDFRYRVPGIRNWLTLYADSYCEDDPSPLAAPRRAAINPGIYLTHVPGVPRLDFRVEAPSTTPFGFDPGGFYNYVNNQYRSGNTNYGGLLGSWVGRDARALEAWSAYSFSSRNRIELSVRHLKGSANFLPGGSTQTDVAIKSSFQLSRDWNAGLFIQHENFFVPILGPRDSNISGWMQVTWEPNLQVLGKGTRK